MPRHLPDLPKQANGHGSFQGRTTSYVGTQVALCLGGGGVAAYGPGGGALLSTDFSPIIFSFQQT